MTTIESVVRWAARLAREEKADDVVVLDLRGIADFTDFFVIASAASERRRRTVVDRVEVGIRERFGRKPLHLEGYPAGGWVLADYVDFVVHVLSPEWRESVQLERLWGDAERLEPEAAEPPEDPAARPAAERDPAP